MRKITLDELIGRLKPIAEAESIRIDGVAPEIIAWRGERSVRDALSLPDQIIACSGRTVTADITRVVGLIAEGARSTKRCRTPSAR